jgi:Rrf2 family protein
VHLCLTRAGEHGVRVATALAAAGRRVPAREITRLADVPPGQVPRVVARLARAGLLINRPGSGGGCRLARPPDAISVLEVVEAIEGRLVRDRCALDRERPHGTVGFCAIHEAWTTAQEAVAAALGSVSLADLARWPSPHAWPPAPLEAQSEAAQ